MTLANRITIVRLLLIPVFIGLIISYTREHVWIRYTALGVYVTAALSDILDGFIARAYNQKTKLGAVLDPLADKLIVNLGFVFLAVNDQFAMHLPMWFPAVILARDVVLVIGAYLINEYYGPVRVPPSITGKLTTVFQMSLVIAILLELRLAFYLMIATLAMAALSYAHYMYIGIKQVGNEDEV